MSQLSLRVDHVYKKFTRGERHDSLRDLIPALAKHAMRRAMRPMALKKEEFWALNDVCFEIQKGEAVGVIGHNGAGKSTILKHLSGIMRPTSGTVEVCGRLSALIEVGAGFHPDLTGRENVFLNGVILGMSRSEIRRKFDEIIEFAGLKEFVDTPVKRYSSGMHARLGFSIAAHLEPDILVIDEVLSVGDYTFQGKGIEKMKSVLRNGTTVIFVSHNLRAVADLCPRCLLLDHGRILADGPTTDILRTYMNQIGVRRVRQEESDTEIESVVIRGADGAALAYRSGDKMWVDVKLRARRRTRNFSCVLFVKDRAFYQIFDISTERLGSALLSLEAGEERMLCFELSLHLASGTFHVGVALRQHDTEKWFELMDPVASITVTSSIDVGRSVNLYPKVQVHAAVSHPTSEAKAV
jgi:ABC-type polysaccharide/polyol phosphate transport system ATPase subunit